MPPKTTRKNKTVEQREAQPAASTALLRDMAAHADRSIEVAAIIRATAGDIINRFHSDDGRLPVFLLQRRGAGPRAATTAAIVDAEIALEELARTFDARAREILDLPIALGERDAPEPGDFTSDEVVSREMVELELKVSRRSGV